jgi:DNA repair protein RadD
VSNGGGVKVDVSKVKHKGGEFLDSALESLYMSKTTEIVADIVKHGANRKAWLIFCVSIEHAEQVTQELITEHDINAACYHSQSDNDYILDDFSNGRLKCLVNVNILTTGSNFPIADMCVLIRATESTALYVQIVGRVMRLYPNKKNALLLDYGSNVLRHGCIDDVTVKAKGEGEGEAPSKQCPSCDTILHAAARECPECGYIFEREPDKKLDLTAYDGAVLSDQRKIQRVDVDRVSFKIHKKIGKPDSIKVTYHCGLAEYYEWLTPEHSDFGLKKTCSFFRRLCKLNDSAFVFFRKCDDFMTFTKSEYFRIDRKITAIDILPSKYTEVKNHYWSKV